MNFPITASLTILFGLGGLGLTNGQPPPEVQPFQAGVTLENGLPPWYAAPPPPASKPKPAPKPRTVSVPHSVEEWRPLVAAYFRAEDVDRALCLMGYESAGNPNAKNPNSTASGLFQILRFWWAPRGIDPFDPESNVALAAEIRDSQGWRAWSPYNRGLCH